MECISVAREFASEGEVARVRDTKRNVTERRGAVAAVVFGVTSGTPSLAPWSGECRLLRQLRQHLGDRVSCLVTRRYSSQ